MHCQKGCLPADSAEATRKYCGWYFYCADEENKSRRNRNSDRLDLHRGSKSASHSTQRKRRGAALLLRAVDSLASSASLSSCTQSHQAWHICGSHKSDLNRSISPSTPTLHDFQFNASEMTQECRSISRGSSTLPLFPSFSKHHILSLGAALQPPKLASQPSQLKSRKPMSAANTCARYPRYELHVRTDAIRI